MPSMKRQRAVSSAQRAISVAQREGLFDDDEQIAWLRSLIADGDSSVEEALDEVATGNTEKLRNLLSSGKNEHIRARIATLSTDGRFSENFDRSTSVSLQPRTASLSSFMDALEACAGLAEGTDFGDLLSGGERIDGIIDELGEDEFGVMSQGPGSLATMDELALALPRGSMGSDHSHSAEQPKSQIEIYDDYFTTTRPPAHSASSVSSTESSARQLSLGLDAPLWPSSSERVDSVETSMLAELAKGDFDMNEFAGPDYLQPPPPVDQSSFQPQHSATWSFTPSMQSSVQQPESKSSPIKRLLSVFNPSTSGQRHTSSPKTSHKGVSGVDFVGNGGAAEAPHHTSQQQFPPFHHHHHQQQGFSMPSGAHASWAPGVSTRQLRVSGLESRADALLQQGVVNASQRELLQVIAHKNDEYLLGRLENALIAAEHGQPEHLQELLRIAESLTHSSSAPPPNPPPNSLMSTWPPVFPMPMGPVSQVAGHQVVHMPPVDMDAHKKSIEAYIDHLESAIRQRKNAAVQLRNANKLDQALIVMKEVKKLQSQKEMYTAQLSYIEANYGKGNDGALGKS